LKVLKFLDDNFEKMICVFLFAWVVFWIFFQVITRYLIKSVYWSGTEELARYSYIWMVFLGAPMLVRFNEHLKVDVLAGVLGSKKAIYIDLIWEMIAFLYFLYLLPFAYKIFAGSLSMGRYYPSTHLPQALFQFSLPACCALMCVRNLELMIRQIASLKKKGDPQP